ncbi:hypothetical protein Pelo_7438 [Pelomyxa schiedti]|nr:hypothetical protein Pelo_7438 [Pelomyxa schiedti]
MCNFEYCNNDDMDTHIKKECENEAKFFMEQLGATVEFPRLFWLLITFTVITKPHNLLLNLEDKVLVLKVAARANPKSFGGSTESRLICCGSPIFWLRRYLLKYCNPF